MRSLWTCLCISTATIALSSSPVFARAAETAPLTERHRFDIPEQGMASALMALAAQSDVRILFPYDEVAPYRGREIKGWLTTDEALSRLIAGRPLKLKIASERTVAIASTLTRLGRARPGITQLADASLAGGGRLMLASLAATAAAAPPPAEGGDEIIVTGTRVTNRTVAESLAPIDVLGKADLQSSGKQSVRDLLGTLVPSINVSNNGAGASFAVKTLSLRGLAGDQVLVLVNGKRRHNTATLFINGQTQNGQSPPDLDLIGSNGIERIEVLRDGASAQYGSDAIAGVVNIILKKDDGGSASMLGGATADGGGEQGRMQADYGFALGDGGHLHLSADGYMQARTIRGQPIFPYPAVRLYPLINGQPDPRELTADRYRNKPGQPQVDGINTSYDASLPVGDAIELYSFGTWSKRHADSWLTYRNPNANNNIIALYPEGYIPKVHVHDQDFQVAAGGRGDVGGIHYDLSTTYSKNRVDYVETTALNASLGPLSPTTFYIGYVRDTEWTTNLDLTDKFNLGLAEPLSAAIGAEYRRDTYTIGTGEPASYIDGGYRDPATGLFPGVARVSGSQGVTGFPPSASGTFKRNNWSAYIDLEQKIIEGVEVALAGRHEDYSDFGKNDSGKASIRIEPVRGIAIRGTASTGFRAPTLQQQHYASSSTIGILLPGATTTTLAPVRALPVDDPVARAWGSQPLKPEKSVNYSAGLVLTPVSRLNITIDAYQIKIKDRIMLSGTLTGAPLANGTPNALGLLLQNAGLNPYQSGFFFSNAASTRTRGLDIVGTYRASLGTLGAATLSLSANFNKTIFTRLEVPSVLSAIGVSLIDRARQGDFTQGMPRNKFIANILWGKGKVSLNLRATRYGKIVQVAAAKAADGIYHDDPINPKVIVDLEAGYQLTKGIKLSVGANNLLNTYPSVLDAVNQGNTGFAYYNTYSPYGISGGFYYGKVSFNF